MVVVASFDPLLFPSYSIVCTIGRPFVCGENDMSGGVVNISISLPLLRPSCVRAESTVVVVVVV